ncbi:hypothetical protein HDU96_005206 [Phlyctochytrium bullatum]|nr:hypothetical protein HDU96_005206 [Phlyctochytrium bullatum]
MRDPDVTGKPARYELRARLEALDKALSKPKPPSGAFFYFQQDHRPRVMMLPEIQAIQGSGRLPAASKKISEMWRTADVAIRKVSVPALVTIVQRQLTLTRFYRRPSRKKYELINEEAKARYQNEMKLWTSEIDKAGLQFLQRERDLIGKELRPRPDPFRPKRPLTMFMLFVTDMWRENPPPEVKQKDLLTLRDLGAKEKVAMFGEIWRVLPQEVKDRYKARYEELKREYEKALKEYNEES